MGTDIDDDGSSGDSYSADLSSGIPEPVDSPSSHQEAGWDLVSLQESDYVVAMDESSPSGASRHKVRRNVPKNVRGGSVAPSLPKLRRSFQVLDAACGMALKRPQWARELAVRACRIAVENGDKDVEHQALNLLRAFDREVLQ